MYREVRRGYLQKRTLAAAAAAIVIAVVICGSISGLAKGRRQNPNCRRYYASIMIERGDTLWSIASKHMTPGYDRVEEYIDEIRRLNHLSGDGIYAGEYLTIPCGFQEM